MACFDLGWCACVMSAIFLPIPGKNESVKRLIFERWMMMEKCPYITSIATAKWGSVWGFKLVYLSPVILCVMSFLFMHIWAPPTTKLLHCIGKMTMINAYREYRDWDALGINCEIFKFSNSSTRRVQTIDWKLRRLTDNTDDNTLFDSSLQSMFQTQTLRLGSCLF